MNRKSNYANLEKFAKTKRNQQSRYRQKTGAYKYRNLWTAKADELVLAQTIPDRELSPIIEHSVGAIQKRRHVLRQMMIKE